MILCMNLYLHQSSPFHRLSGDTLGMPLGEIYSASPTELHHLYSPYPSKLQALSAAHYQICLHKGCSPVPQLKQIINSCNTTIYYQSMYFNPPPLSTHTTKQIFKLKYLSFCISPFL